MPKSLVITTLAEEDLTAISEWYENDQHGLAVKFMTEAEQAFQSICDFPEMADWISDNIRRKQMKRFPYVIFFEINADAVVVRGLFHTARSTSVWKRRLRG